ncbi:MAG: LacI family DNA-binding transcriptional regulator [Ktedonobacteraceae bacterium]|nr:LacI family DNA-binding transcriptional regulator [Ktedonobacteraceae bacterium]
MAKKLTIDDIAHLAGVSKTTVSRVLNHKADVDPETRERILQIIEEQGFVPSVTASGLARGSSRLIGMLIPSWVWPVIPDLMRGIVEVVNETQYDLVLYSVNDEDLERDRSEAIDRLLATQLTAGLLAIFPARLSAHLTHLYHQGFPVVTIDDQEAQTTPWVGADNTTGAYNAVRHLISLGHRRIAHIRAPAEYLVSDDRYRGYCQALFEAGITPDPELVLVGDFLPPSGRACAHTFFELPAEKRPTAIFAASDQMAYGVLAAAEECGLSIPGDIALVGFDDDAPSVHTRPSLTTVRQPFFEMGKQGIELLLSILTPDMPRIPLPARRSRNASQPGGAPLAGDPTQPTRILLPTSLVVRASCGANYHISINVNG